MVRHASLEELPAHSPLGASGSHRWMECPGSVTLGQGVRDEEDDTFSKPGTAAHALAAYCLANATDAWQYIGLPIGKPGDDLSPFAAADGAEIVDKEMADATQLYLDDVRRWHPRKDWNQGNAWIEKSFYTPWLHKFFYGQTDFGFADDAARTLHVWDFKYGAGIVVEAEDNPQAMYYAAGLLESIGGWSDFDQVVIHIHQPRFPWHSDGVHRVWPITTSALKAWLLDTLIPAMEHALVSRETKSGEHCRFCPVRGRACPQLMKEEEELRIMTETILKDDASAARLTPEQAGRFATLMEVAKIRYKAVGPIVFGLLQGGNKVPGWKLAKAKSNRVWKEGAEAALAAKFGDDAYTPKKIKTPKQIEALPEGEDYAARYGFKPDAGLTAVPLSDTRGAVTPAATKVQGLIKPVKKGK